MCRRGSRPPSACSRLFRMFKIVPHMPPMFKCPAAPEAVPVAGVGGIDLTGGELQDLLGGPAPGVWVGLDMKQLRGEAEVGVLRGRGNVDLELGWGGRVSLHLPGSLPLGSPPALPTHSELRPGCPSATGSGLRLSHNALWWLHLSGAMAGSHPQLPLLPRVFDQVCPHSPFDPLPVLFILFLLSGPHWKVYP